MRFILGAMLDASFSTPMDVGVESIFIEAIRVLVHAVRVRQSDFWVDSASKDSEDIRLAGQGDGDAYRRLIERYQDHVARVLWRFSRDRRVHEELVQDVFVESYLSLSRYRGEAPFEHWLTRIATRVGYRYWKEKARQRKTEPLDLQEWDKATEGDCVAQSLEPDQAAELLHRVFERLAPRDRLVLTLRYLEQCDVAETARRTGWTQTMVKVQTLRARNRLRKLLEQSPMEWNK
ncbi:MAG TPA: RNA polymerase sigma factor [Sedimentisphaerales bacterium]|nr:RNA polymerase sigma factor [Sedimentisphaerales bacterium]